MTTATEVAARLAAISGIEPGPKRYLGTPVRWIVDEDGSALIWIAPDLASLTVYPDGTVALDSDRTPVADMLELLRYACAAAGEASR